MKIAIFIDIFHDNETKIAEYVRNQLQEDIMSDKISRNGYLDLFTGEKVNRKNTLEWLPVKSKRLANDSIRLKTSSG